MYITNHGDEDVSESLVPVKYHIQVGCRIHNAT